MQGTLLKFYVYQNQKHKGILIHEWLLVEAKKMGLPGGTSFLSIASFGHKGNLNTDHFYSMGGNMAVEVIFALSEAQAKELLIFLKKEELNLFYIKTPAEFGFSLE